MTATRTQGEVMGGKAWLVETNGCCMSILVVLALKAGRGLPTGMPYYKSVVH